MKAQMTFKNMHHLVSPYVAKKVFEKVYKSENFKYFVDRIVFLNAPTRNENDTFSLIECIIFFHVKGIHKTAKPIQMKPLEKKIVSLLGEEEKEIRLDGEGPDATVVVCYAKQKKAPAFFDIVVNNMLLNVETTKNRLTIRKEFDAHIVGGVLDLQKVKPRVVKPREYDYVHVGNPIE